MHVVLRRSPRYVIQYIFKYLYLRSRVLYEGTSVSDPFPLRYITSELEFQRWFFIVYNEREYKVIRFLELPVQTKVVTTFPLFQN